MRPDSSQTLLRRALILGAAILPWTAWGAESAEEKALALRLQQLAGAMEDLGATRTRILGGGQDFGTDIRGRTFRQDVAEYLLPDPVREDIRSRQREIPKLFEQGDRNGALKSLITLNETVNGQVQLFNGMLKYWRRVEPVSPAGAVPIRAVAADEAVKVEELRARRDAELARGEFVNVVTRTLPELESAEKILREKESLQLSESLRDGRMKPLLDIQPRERCTPASRTSGSLTPALGNNFPNSDDYKPARYRGGQIKVTVAVVVNDQGCARRIFVTESSGLDYVDEAGLELARDGTYLPAEKDGVAAGGAVQFRVKFTP